MSNKLSERIACIKSDTLFQKGKWNGMQTKNLPYYRDLILNNLEFKPRNKLEEDKRYKQIIAQVVLKYNDKYFLHKQVSKNEQRLNSLCPLPLGGHIELFDKEEEGMDIIETAMYREMNEEADIKANIVGKNFLGLVYVDDNNPVNLVHVGFVYLFELDTDDVSIKEEGLEDIGFVDIEYLRDNKESLTYWSREIIDYL